MSCRISRLLWIGLLLSVAGCAEEELPKATEEEESPPANIHEYYTWANAAKDPERRYERLRGFWESNHPGEGVEGKGGEETGESSDDYPVLAKSAWDLLETAHLQGDAAAFAYYLDWLKRHDSLVYRQLRP